MNNNTSTIIEIAKDFATILKCLSVIVIALSELKKSTKSSGRPKKK
jgi:hypothetical protein